MKDGMASLLDAGRGRDGSRQGRCCARIRRRHGQRANHAGIRGRCGRLRRGRGSGSGRIPVDGSPARLRLRNMRVQRRAFSGRAGVGSRRRECRSRRRAVCDRLPWRLSGRRFGVRRIRCAPFVRGRKHDLTGTQWHRRDFLNRGRCNLADWDGNNNATVRRVNSLGNWRRGRRDSREERRNRNAGFEIERQWTKATRLTRGGGGLRIA